MQPDSLIGGSTLDCMVQIAEQCPEGAFAEVGVYSGGSAYRLYEVAERQGRSLYLYDTFAGMPYSGPLDPHPVGDLCYTDTAQLQRLMPNARIVKGVFPDSVVEMPPLAFVHVDCDQHDSIAGCILTLVPLLVSGGAIIFDDYGCMDGATKAVDDHIPKEQLSTAPSGKAMFRKP